jgi:hypothetical protein
MTELIPLIPGAGVTGVLVLTILSVFRAVYTGSLVPRTTYQDVLNDRDNWRKAHELSEERRRLQDEQVQDLLELAKTSNSILTAWNRVKDSA